MATVGRVLLTRQLMLIVWTLVFLIWIRQVVIAVILVSPSAASTQVVPNGEKGSIKHRSRNQGSEGMYLFTLLVDFFKKSDLRDLCCTLRTITQGMAAIMPTDSAISKNIILKANIMHHLIGKTITQYHRPLPDLRRPLFWMGFHLCRAVIIATISLSMCTLYHHGWGRKRLVK